MCAIFGIKSQSIKHYPDNLDILSHRGPDDFGEYTNGRDVYFAHRRLSIIGLDERSHQPMRGRDGSVLTFNGEIYNYQDLKKNELSGYPFKSDSDTEVILALYEKYGVDCVSYLRGMFAFGIWDERNQRLFCARDRFGIKPFYYTKLDVGFVFASEIKALLPYLKSIETNQDALLEYLTFQYTLGSQTLFQDVHQLMPGHMLILEKGQLNVKKYWDVSYEVDWNRSPESFEEELKALLTGSIRYHQISDVRVGSCLSGGIDSSLITVLASEHNPDFYGAFHGRFTGYPGYDESGYAKDAAVAAQKELFTVDITAQDFAENIQKVIYHLDVPVAGPGSFPQYMVSKLASQHVKVVLGGQGGDELFGGYARYIIAYFEQCIKAAIEGNHRSGNFVVTPESIIPNLETLKEYKPLLQSFWKEGLFGSLDARYFRLIDRSNDTYDEINWALFDKRALFPRFQSLFNDHVPKSAYFDKMTRFDFKCLLPALLHVEDRMSMAHGLESRVPFLDHPLVEFAATIPADIKFPGGKMKSLLRTVFKEKIPSTILNRRDKMGFPVPLKEWFSGPLKGFVRDVFSSSRAGTRGFYDPQKVLDNLENTAQFSRKIWGLLSLELWHQSFHDRAHEIKNSLTRKPLEKCV